MIFGKLFRSSLNPSFLTFPVTSTESSLAETTCQKLLKYCSRDGLEKEFFGLTKLKSAMSVSFLIPSSLPFSSPFSRVWSLFPCREGREKGTKRSHHAMKKPLYSFAVLEEEMSWRILFVEKKQSVSWSSSSSSYSRHSRYFNYFYMHLFYVTLNGMKVNEKERKRVESREGNG